MIFDGVPLDELSVGKSGLRDASLRAAIRFVEKRSAARLFYDVRRIPFERPDLAEPLYLADLLKRTDVIQSFGQMNSYPDEPRLKYWYAICNNASSHQAGGSSWTSDADALYASLAEGLERYLWYTQTDYYSHPKQATATGIAKFGRALPLESIAGFSEDQRSINAKRAYGNDTEFLWIRGTSLVRGDKIYLPAQLVSGVLRSYGAEGTEPLLRQPTTNGLATWPTQAGARLRGTLEVIEREAFMIMWLNQLVLPRISLPHLSATSADLARCLAACEKYRFKVHAVQLPTDAPTHVTAVVLEDMSDLAPRFSVGLKAHRSLPLAVEKAMMEALRARRGYRKWADAGNAWDEKTPVETIGHRERIHFWGVPEHAKKLEFLISGPEQQVSPASWETYSEEEHFKALLSWCAQEKLECIAIPLGTSKKNPTDLHVEMIVIPQLQPAYLTEPTRAFGGTRWRDVAKKLGYTPRKQPFTDAPHPFS